MTETAIDLLDNPEGFFLQVESAMIDKQEHDLDICGAIGDVESLDETVEVALDYQRTHPDTLVIVTGDHAQATQIVRNVEHGRQTATLRTADGDPLTVAYSTDIGRRRPHRHPDPGRSDRPGGIRGDRHDRPDRPLRHHARRPAGHVTGTTPADAAGPGYPR